MSATQTITLLEALAASCFRYQKALLIIVSPMHTINDVLRCHLFCPSKYTYVHALNRQFSNKLSGFYCLSPI